MRSKVKLDTSGLKKLQKNIERASKELSGPVSVAELFPASFMSKYTNFSSFEAMLEASGFKVDSMDDFLAIPDNEFDSYIRSCSRLDSWDDMKAKAAEERFAKALKF